MKLIRFSVNVLQNDTCLSIAFENFLFRIVWTTFPFGCQSDIVLPIRETLISFDLHASKGS